jgi:2,3-bisphosphoglycerate-dependent phosphoglycerate mutase
MRLTLVRHAESVANVQNRHSGQADHPLSDEGLRQAALLAERLAEETFDAIYVSDLTRTRQTAEPIIATHPETPVTYDPRLREKHLGVLEGQDRGETKANVWGEVEGGEPPDAFRARVIGFLDELFERHQGEHVLIVSHGGYLTTLLMHLAGSNDPKAYHPSNASVSTVEFDLEGNHTISIISDDAHLAGSQR